MTDKVGTVLDTGTLSDILGTSYLVETVPDTVSDIVWSVKDIMGTLDMMRTVSDIMGTLDKMRTVSDTLWTVVGAEGEIISVWLKPVALFQSLSLASSFPQHGNITRASPLMKYTGSGQQGSSDVTKAFFSLKW